MSDEIENPRGLMNKKVAKIFPTYLLGYDNPNYVDQNKHIIEVLDKEAFTPGPQQPWQTLDNHLESRSDFKEFFTWVYECLEDYRRTFMYHCDEFKIVIAWANKANQAGAHNMHVHPNSFISGVYYVTENPTPTMFEDPRYQLRSGITVASHSQMESKVFEGPSEAGLLVLFPSWLPHFTESSKFDGIRYTISFNVVPAGATNKGSLTEFNY
jgi:uncharacterized protein (TIGR02466 family)